MTSLDHLIVTYRHAWKNLFHTEPPIIRKVSDRGVIIKSEHGSHYLNANHFHRRIDDMQYWGRT